MASIAPEEMIGKDKIVPEATLRQRKAHPTGTLAQGTMADVGISTDDAKDEQKDAETTWGKTASGQGELISRRSVA